MHTVTVDIKNVKEAKPSKAMVFILHKLILFNPDFKKIFFKF